MSVTLISVGRGKVVIRYHDTAVIRGVLKLHPGFVAVVSGDHVHHDHRIERPVHSILPLCPSHYPGPPLAPPRRQQAPGAQVPSVHHRQIGAHFSSGASFHQSSARGGGVDPSWPGGRADDSQGSRKVHEEGGSQNGLRQPRAHDMETGELLPGQNLLQVFPLSRCDFLHRGVDLRLPRVMGRISCKKHII